MIGIEKLPNVYKTKTCIIQRNSNTFSFNSKKSEFSHKKITPYVYDTNNTKTNNNNINTYHIKPKIISVDKYTLFFPNKTSISFSKETT